MSSQKFYLVRRVRCVVPGWWYRCSEKNFLVQFGFSLKTVQLCQSSNVHRNNWKHNGDFSVDGFTSGIDFEDLLKV